MPYYSCAVCFFPLVNSQRHTCGAKACLDQWKEWGKFAPAKQKAQKNLSTLSPTERALVLASRPTPTELEERTTQRDEDELAAPHTQEESRLPKFLRDALITNAPIKKEGGETE